ncbi:hypothetical protein GMD21_09975 [Ruminococcus faecis]|uniref:HTH LytTR-type domain-containing protein n=1 Tax=Mediterraneibacter faecis TaxID=592978 RepID=A0A844KEQ2_9FIRM|nr:hypothetical protein [Mediterraneibacter faecis]
MYKNSARWGKLFELSRSTGIWKVRIKKTVKDAKKQVVEFTGHLKSVEVQLDYRFYRCHRSYIVNTDNIKEVNFQKLIIYMENGEICPISVRAKTSLKKYYNEHLISIGNTVTRISKKCNNE